uniref:Uncharacterized protein n=1 Tax=Tanacetum cinerariifolium TaxID=118510 RepID=A0A6L2MHT6_TANCI|nr:hypothetical protein [Tanacetum cinerariifolium]
MVKEEVKSQFPKEISDFATPLIKSTIAESYENVVLAKSFSQSNIFFKRERKDKDKDEDPSTRPDRGLKRRKSSTDDELYKDPKSKGSKSSSSSKGTSRTQHKPTGKSAHAEEPSHDSGVQQDQEFEIGINDDQPDKKNASKQNCLKIENLTQEILVRPAYNLLKEGQVYPFDLSKPLPLIQDDRGRQVILVDYFINNDLEYLKVEKQYDYRYLKEIVVRREDQKLYNFNKGDFPRLNLCDIEDLRLFLVQKKLLDLEKDVIFDLNVALGMFTRRIIILKRVEDLQLGVESYHNKLNITRPETSKLDIRKLTLYTAYNNPQGIIYLDKFQRNKLMCLDELYMFCDGTLNSVRSVLLDILNNLRMKYLPKRD